MKKMTKSQKILMTILIIVVMGLLARFVVFKTQFDEWGEGLERVGSWQEEYKTKHPNATKKDMDEAFDEGMTNLKKWQEKYKSEHPNATDAEIDAAFKEQWN